HKASRNSARVDDTDTDNPTDNPTKLKLLRLVSWQYLDVLTDRHYTNELWICASKDLLWRDNLGDDNISTEDVAVETGLEDFSVSDRVNLRSASVTCGLPVKHISELVDVHEVLSGDKVPTIDLTLKVEKTSLRKLASGYTIVESLELVFTTLGIVACEV